MGKIEDGLVSTLVNNFQGVRKINSFTAAIIVHMINNRVCALNGEQQIQFEDMPEYMRDGLVQALEDDLSPEDGHVAWMKNRLENGWTLGPVKDIEKKTSPCLIPYSELPYEQRVKDAIRCGVRDFLRQYKMEGNWETGVVRCGECGREGVIVVPFDTEEPFICDKCDATAMVFVKKKTDLKLVK
jgi:hypothetical protein